jgi:hypothetical protein
VRERPLQAASRGGLFISWAGAVQFVRTSTCLVNETTVGATISKFQSAAGAIHSLTGIGVNPPSFLGDNGFCHYRSGLRTPEVICY